MCLIRSKNCIRFLTCLTTNPITGQSAWQFPHFYILMAVALFLSGCSTRSIEKIQYLPTQNQHLHGLEHWRLKGRIAMSNASDSWSANIDWVHEKNKESIGLSGPLGQGSARIVLLPDLIVIDQGDGKVGYSTNIDSYIKQQLGFVVPVTALRFWVLGLPAPDRDFVRLEEGFEQLLWEVHFLSFIPVGNNLMPRKIIIKKKSAKLKLVVEQWIFNGN